MDGLSDLTKEELEALNADFDEMRPSAWQSFWQTHDRAAFFFTLGFVAGIIALVGVFDAWLYIWN